MGGVEVDRTVISAPNATRNLPSIIFETKGVELKVGLLNQAAPTNGISLFFVKFYNTDFVIKCKKFEIKK